MRRDIQTMTRENETAERSKNTVRICDAFLIYSIGATYFDVIRSKDDPAAERKTDVEDDGTHHEPQNVGRRVLNRHQQNLDNRFEENKFQSLAQSIVHVDVVYTLLTLYLLKYFKYRSTPNQTRRLAVPSMMPQAS